MRGAFAADVTFLRDAAITPQHALFIDYAAAFFGACHRARRLLPPAMMA